MVNPVGFEFRPTDEEIVDHYLRIKNLNSNTSDVDQVINTVDICSFDPWHLPSQSKLTSKDQVWYFFGRKENKYNKGDRQSRKTKSGFWKKTGVTMDVLQKRGTREKIGEKKVLVFHSSKKSQSVTKSDWVIHEYHATFLSPKMMTYKICKVEFKGEEKDISYCYCGGEDEHNHSLIPPIENSAELSVGSEGWPHNQELVNQRLFTDFLDEQQETQLDHAIGRAFDVTSEDLKRLLNNDYTQSEIVLMQENCSDYKPKKSLTGVITGHSSDDSDSDLTSVTTVSTTFQCSLTTLSACNSFTSSNHRIDQIKDLQESPNSTTIKLVSLTPEVSQLLGQESEIGEHKLGQETIKKRKADFFYRIIQRFVKRIHLCSSVSRT